MVPGLGGRRGEGESCKLFGIKGLRDLLARPNLPEQPMSKQMGEQHGAVWRSGVSGWRRCLFAESNSLTQRNR